MHKMRPYLFFLLLFLAAYTTGLPAQDDCYPSIRAEGLRLLGEERFDKAIDQFIAARFCLDRPQPDDLDSLIRKAQRAWVAALEAARDSSELHLRQTLAAKAEIERQRQVADSLRRQAENYAREAIQEAILAEANRLALQSENMRREAKYTDAIYLAFRARQLLQERETPPLRLTFGEAVPALYARTIQSSQAAFIDFLPSPDGKKILCISTDGTATLASLHQTAPSVSLRVGEKPVLTGAFSGDGRYILTGFRDGTAQLWNDRGEPLAQLTGHHGAILGAIFALQSERLLTWSRDNTAMLWDCEGTQLATCAGHTAPVYNACFSPDERYILTRSADGAARLWDNYGRPLAVLSGHRWYLYDAGFSPDGQLIATASADSTAALWDWSGRRLATLSGHRSAVKKITFSQDGHGILSQGRDSIVRLWDREGRLIAELAGTGPTNVALFNRTGDLILTGEESGRVRLWDRQARPLATLTGHRRPIRGAVFSPDDHWLLTSSPGEASRLWDRQGHLVMTLPNRSTTGNARFTIDGQGILFFTAENNVSYCPIPEAVYRELQDRLPFSEEDIQRMNREHQIPDFVQQEQASFD